MSLAQIEKLSEKYSTAANELFSELQSLDKKIAALTAEHQPALDKLVKKVSKAQSDLHTKIEAHPELFEKPRTQVFAGIKVGFQGGKDKLVIADSEKTCTLIQKHFPEMEGVLLQTSTKPVASAVSNLKPAQLKKIGATIEAGTDSVVLKPVDSAVSKAVSAQLNAAE